MHLFSIIVPVYNVEKYLDECVRSLVSQAYGNIEIILVDDGSEDSSGAMCDEFGRMDSRIRVIHKQNGGLSSARNAGLEQAKGDYVLYVDSDDYISLDFLALIERQLLAVPCDMIMAKAVKFTDGSRPKTARAAHEIQGEVSLTPEEALETIYYQELSDTNAWAKVMRAEIARKHPFTEGILYEDFKNIYWFISECGRILYMSAPKYFYRQRSDSIMNSPYEDRKLILIDIAEENLSLVKENYPDIAEAAVRRYVYSNFHILGKVVRVEGMPGKAEELRGNILKYQKNILRNGRIGMKEKVSICILRLGLKPYKIVWGLYCRIKGKAV